MEYKETIINVETGEVTERPYTEGEIKAMEEQIALSQARLAAEQAEAVAKETAKAAVLDRLGITAEEAQLLLGGN
jgi:hypothetical protein